MTTSGTPDAVPRPRRLHRPPPLRGPRALPRRHPARHRRRHARRGRHALPHRALGGRPRGRPAGPAGSPAAIPASTTPCSPRTATCCSSPRGPTPGASGDDPPAALWCLPATGGEARPAGTRPGGLAGPVVARRAGTRRRHLGDAARRRHRRRRRGAAGGPDDRQGDRHPARGRRRSGSGTTTSAPTGHGCSRPRRPAGRDRRPGPTSPRPGRGARAGGLRRHPGRVDGGHDLAGRRTVRRSPPRARRAGPDRLPAHRRHSHRVLLDDPGHTVDGPVAVSPDGRWVACLRTRRTSATEPPDVRCVVVPVDGANRATSRRAGTAGSPAVAWTPDSAALVVTADDTGRAPLYRIDLATGTVTRLTDDDGAYSDPVVGPDGTVYALRSAVDAPPAPVRLGPEGPVPRSPTPLPPPAPTPPLPGTLTEVTATAADGTRAARLARAARRRVGHHPAAAAAVDPRRAAEQLERLALAVEPLGDGRARLRGAAPRPRAVHRVRARVRHPRVGPLGRRALHRRPRAHRRR